MLEKSREQGGGAATIDPGPLRRWLTSRVVSRMVVPGRLEKSQALAERKRVRAGQAHRLEYFHQVDDAYSHLAAQALRPLLDRYQLELVPHLVHTPSGVDLPEPDLLPDLSRYDAALVAPHYGLTYPHGAPVPRPELQIQADRILAAVDVSRFPEAVVSVGEALLAGNEAGLKRLAEYFGQVADTEAEWALDRGTARRAKLGHYAGAMFFYGGQWYWGVDRLCHLEQRLRGLV